MKIFNLFAIALFLFATLQLNAQLRTPQPSPGCTITQTVGLTDVTIEYSRPAVRGRTIFAANGLVPYGEIWRTGANSATKITFSEEVKLAGKDVKKGSYAILTVPNAGEWTFKLYPYDTGNFTDYVEKEPAVSFTVPAQTWDISVESMTFEIHNITNSSADIMFLWANTAVAFPLTVHTDEQVMAQFKKMEAGPSTNDYYAMGNYLFESGGDLKQALEYVQKATKGDNPAFWQLHREALILGKMGRKDEAIQTAMKSIDLAKKAGNNDYVRLNEQAIADWKKM